MAPDDEDDGDLYDDEFDFVDEEDDDLSDLDDEEMMQTRTMQTTTPN